MSDFSRTSEPGPDPQGWYPLPGGLEVFRCLPLAPLYPEGGREAEEEVQEEFELGRPAEGGHPEDRRQVVVEQVEVLVDPPHGFHSRVPGCPHPLWHYPVPSPRFSPPEAPAPRTPSVSGWVSRRTGVLRRPGRKRRRRRTLPTPGPATLTGRAGRRPSRKSDSQRRVVPTGGQPLDVSSTRTPRVSRSTPGAPVPGRGRRVG